MYAAIQNDAHKGVYDNMEKHEFCVGEWLPHWHSGDLICLQIGHVAQVSMAG